MKPPLYYGGRANNNNTKGAKMKETIKEYFLIYFMAGIFMFTIVYITAKKIDKMTIRDCKRHNKSWIKKHRNICPKKFDKFYFRGEK